MPPNPSSPKHLPYLFKEESWLPDTAGPFTDMPELTQQLQLWYPELAHWSAAGLMNAWATYSLATYLVEVVDFLEERDNGFLAFLYIREQCAQPIQPDAVLSDKITFMEDLWDYADTSPWLTRAALPGWASII